MTQAQLGLQNQQEKTFSNLITQLFFNDSPVLFLEPIDQVNARPSEQTQYTTSSKAHNPFDNTHEIPAPPQTRYEITKDPVFLSSPIFSPTIPTKPSLSTNRDDHLIPLLSQDNFTFKAQLTSLYMYPTDYTFRLYDKNQGFFKSIASKIMFPYQYWLDNGLKIFSLQFNFLRPSIYDLKTDKLEPSFLSLSQKASHHETNSKFLQHTKPQNYIFVIYIYT